MPAHEALNGELFPETRGTTASKTEWPDVTAGMRPLGKVKEPRSLTYKDVPTFPGAKDTQRIRPAAGMWTYKPVNQPMAMFHTAREIREGWRPAEGDRRYHDTMVPAGGKRDPASIVRGDVVHDHPEGKPVSVETDSQMWERKLDEATSIGYADRGGYKETLAQHLSSGGARNIQPVHLGHLANPVDKHLDPRADGRRGPAPHRSDEPPQSRSTTAGGSSREHHRRQVVGKGYS